MRNWDSLSFTYTHTPCFLLFINHSFPLHAEAISSFQPWWISEPISGCHDTGFPPYLCSDSLCWRLPLCVHPSHSAQTLTSHSRLFPCAGNLLTLTSSAPQCSRPVCFTCFLTWGLWQCVWLWLFFCLFLLLLYFILFYFIKAGLLCVALAVLELAL